MGGRAARPGDAPPAGAAASHTAEARRLIDLVDHCDTRCSCCELAQQRGAGAQGRGPAWRTVGMPPPPPPSRSAPTVLAPRAPGGTVRRQRAAARKGSYPARVCTWERRGGANSAEPTVLNKRRGKGPAARRMRGRQRFLIKRGSSRVEQRHAVVHLLLGHLNGHGCVGGTLLRHAAAAAACRRPLPPLLLGRVLLAAEKAWRCSLYNSLCDGRMCRQQ